MPMTIDDKLLQAAGLTEQDARVEVACRLYDAGKLSLLQAMKWANLSRVHLESALIERGLPIYRITEQDLADDLAAIERLRLKGIGVRHVDRGQ